MKKLVIFLLCMSLVFSALPMNAMAAENDNTNAMVAENDKTNAMAVGSGNASDENETEEVERVIETIDSGRDVFDTLSEGVTTGTQEKVRENVTDTDTDIEEDISALIGINWITVEISNADEFIRFSEDCSLDTWSCNKRVILTDDISLLGRQFSGIPTFGGIFDGKGHTISEVAISDSNSYVGLFSRVQENAVIMNLNVCGTVVPEGEQIIVGGIAGDNAGVIAQCTFEGAVTGNDYVGGIAGMNELTGVISGCEAGGIVRGVHFTGGIAGENIGNIANCTNNAAVNTSNTDITLTEQSISSITSVLDMIDSRFQSGDDEAQARTTVTDTGGIAGLSIGLITHCVNHATIGYEHVGYNTGGIAGRQSGYVYSCINNGEILGRKDIGGIVGQAEPYITIDFSQDVAYQLSEAINKLHDLVNVTLSDTRNQSDVITGRLSVIQQYTTNAITDAKYLAENTVDFANGLSGAATESFSRVDYILAQSSRQDGLLDQTAYAFTNIGSAMEGTKATVADLDLTRYVSDSDRVAYTDATNTIEKSTVEFKDYYSKAYRAYYNWYIWSNENSPVYGTDAANLAYKLGDGSYTYNSAPVNGTTYAGANAPYMPNGSASEKAGLISDFDKDGNWVHYSAPSEEPFPIAGNDNDSRLAADAASAAAVWANTYASEKYLESHGVAYTDDVASAAGDVTRIMYSALDSMSGAARSDAIDSINSLEAAAYNLSSATNQTKNLISDVAGMGTVTFPTLSSDYKAHTTSLADNMQVMNDNFGLLNQEINGATYVLTDDLEAVSDQFNTIMLLYTDALDGVLEQDYTAIFTDDSINVAETSTDATVDSCLNYGMISGDINVAGIAGTMAIEYDYDLESDVTGIKDTQLNTSYITKCVLRGNKNYEEVNCVKSYAGGVCGRQEMGTVIRDENYATISSESGDYVGGIAGSSLSYIISSYAKAAMSGTNYVGGIVGDGVNIRDCMAFADPCASGSWCGAIAGHVSEDGEVRNNFFAGSGAAGIDRVSYSYKAEPVTYKEMTDMGIPADFKHLTVTFMLDDEEADGPVRIARTKVDFGDSISMTDYPEVEPKEGFYVDWDTEGIDPVEEDETVTAVYRRYKTTLSASSANDEVHASDILVDGNFKEDDSFIVARTLNFVEGDNSTLSDYVYYEIMIPDDGASTHRIRFLPDTVYGDDACEVMKLYEDKDGRWVELESAGTMGKYHIYEIEGNKAKLKLDISGIESKNRKYIAVIVIAAIVLIALIGVIIWFMTRRKSRRQIKKAYRKVKDKITDQISSKEQLFVPDDTADITEETEEASPDAGEDSSEETDSPKND